MRILIDEGLRIHDASIRQVVLFYHVLPKDINHIQNQLPYRVPNDRQLVMLAGKVDVVYLATEKIHWYFASKFRNRSNVDIDFRLFIPQCSEEFFHASRAIQPHGLPIGVSDFIVSM